MKFLADTMVGRLARWLRLSNNNTYRPDLADPQLAQLARFENRVLLTRDVELTRRRGVSSVWIASDEITEQLQQMFGELRCTRGKLSRAVANAM